ncbi:preprotein translocase subunit SecG [Microgenomates group bacterium RBG_16_45_19]|nr:MAG: preprotein translocase subunit SecG [Microgenomates group bacterium RBG_16_45_19]
MWLNFIQMGLGLLIIVLVMLQSQGGGLGTTFGGLATYHTKRGLEKGMFFTTIVCVSLFGLLSIISL